MKKKSVILKYLLSYFAVLLIPFAFSYFFITHHVFETMKEELKASTQSNVQQIQFSFDNSIQQMESIVTQFSLNEELHLDIGLQDVASTMLIMDELSRYLYISDFLYEIGIYIQDDSYFYTTKSSSRLRIFLDSILQYEHLTRDEFYQYLSTVEKSIIPSQEVSFYSISREVVTFIIPVNIIDQTEEANIIFLLETDYLEELMNSEENYSEYVILDKNGQEIYSTSREELDIEAICEYAESQNTDSFEYMGDFVMLQQSSYMGLTVISITPLDAVYQTVNQLSVELLLVMVAIFIVGCILIYVAMELNYKPIVRIRELILGYVPGESDSKNEFQLIEESLGYLVTKNENLFNNTKRSSKVFLLRKLLQGAVVSREEFNALGEAYQLHWYKECFAVFTIVFHKKEEEIQVDAEYLEVILNDYFTGYVFTEAQNKYIFVANLSEQELDVFQDGVREAHHSLHQEYEGTQLCIAIGNVYRDIRDVSKSYAESIVAADYRFVRGMDSIIVQHDLLTERNITYPYHLLEKFRAAFKNQNEKITYDTLDEIVKYATEMNCPIHYARSICYDLISILSTSLENMGEVDLTQKINGYYNEILADSVTVEEMIEVAKNICTNIQAYVQADNKMKSMQLIEDIKEDIRQNCFEVNFSIEILADKFYMTFSGISALFKNKTGQTIIDYVTELRMEKAKYYLLNTDMPVAKITEEIGYISSSSFIRKFKGLYGVTPKQYASDHREA